ncbi:MAG: hypothetical protein E6K82_07875 [Candidatus Rokuibacteriota bacterium]|nr:MAG: hypothetical protein E6K82_07875 [Candidatus Rokubacteria bacterium]
MSMLLLGSVTAAFAGDGASKTAIVARAGRTELVGSVTTATFGSQSGRLRVHRPLGLVADHPAASIASPSGLHRARAIESAGTRRDVDREKLLAFLILMLKEDRGAR